MLGAWHEGEPGETSRSLGKPKGLGAGVLTKDRDDRANSFARVYMLRYRERGTDNPKPHKCICVVICVALCVFLQVCAYVHASWLRIASEQMVELEGFVYYSSQV